MEYQVRHARITDAERVAALVDASPAARGGAALGSGATDLLRQLVHLPHAVVLVADADRRIAGAAVLALRPSVRQGGFVGSVDLLVVHPAHEDGGLADALIVELLRSARNKGCVAVEAALPDDPAARARWAGHGFSEAGPHVVRALTPVGAGRT